MKYVELSCPICNNLFNKEKREVTRQNKNGNPIFCSKKCAGRSNSLKRTINFEVIRNCLNCKAEFKSTSHKKHRTCCSRICASRYSQKFVDFSKTSKTLKEFYRKQGKKVKNDKGENNIICKQCGKEFLSTRQILFCSKNCKSLKLTLNKKSFKSSIDRNDLNNLQIYRRNCAFKFNLADFSEEFDFSLVTKYGWYSPKNKKNNLKGVSRDHIFSIRDGFDNQIDPDIISHPANCRLMIHSENIRKNSKSNISIYELLDKIETFNKKYNYNNRGISDKISTMRLHRIGVGEVPTSSTV